VDLVDFIGQGICRRDPSRLLHPDAWLCGRCTALYTAALVGVAASGPLGRRLRLGWQLALGALLVLPVGLEKALVGAGSPLDVMPLRLATGVLGGLGVALVVGARGGRAIRWPEAPWRVLRAIPPWAAALGAAGLGSAALAVGVAAPLDLAAFGGVVALCLVGTAWGLDVAAWAFCRLARRPPRDEPYRHGLVLLLTLATAELVLLAAAPPAWRPGFAWIAPLLPRVW
jgi:uncharacterized membrane protein